MEFFDKDEDFATGSSSFVSCRVLVAWSRVLGLERRGESPWGAEKLRSLKCREELENEIDVVMEMDLR